MAFAAVLFISAGAAFSQNMGAGSSAGSDMSRSSIPEELLRPRREESPRYPIDTVIGPLGQGTASSEAYRFAHEVGAALLAGNMDAPSLSAINRVLLEGYMSSLAAITPRSFRLGSGREEPDGSFSFLIRFIGREQGVTGELFIRFEERRAAKPAATTPPAPADETAPPAETQPPEDGLAPAAGEALAEVAATPAPPEPRKTIWVFDELILEEAKSRETENGESKQQFDFPPYQRFF